MRIAARGRDRHGLRLLGGAGPRPLRPGRARSTARADRRRDRLPAVPSARARDGRLRAVRAVLAHKAYHMGILTDVVPALKVDGRFVATRWSKRKGWSTTTPLRASANRRPARPAKEGKALLARAASTCRCSTAKGRGTVRQDPAHLPRLHDQDAGGTAQAEAGGVEPQQGRLPRLAGAEHDDRGALRLHAFNEGTKDDAKSTSWLCGRSLRRRVVVGPPCTTRSSRRRNGKLTLP